MGYPYFLRSEAGSMPDNEQFRVLMTCGGCLALVVVTAIILVVWLVK